MKTLSYRLLDISKLALLLLTILALTAALTLLAIHDYVTALMVAYPICFLVLAWFKPEIALMLVFASAPFQNDLSGGGFAKFSVAEINLALTVPVFILQNFVRKRSLLPGPITIPVILYFTVCIYSSIVTWREDKALISLVQMFLYFVVAVVIFSSFVPDHRKLIYALNALMVVGVFMAVAGKASNYTFMGLNKNGIGASLACAAIVAIELWFSSSSRRGRITTMLSLSIIAIGLVFSLSRGSWLGTLFGVSAIMLMRRQYNLMFKSILILVPLVAICWNYMPQEDRAYATDFSSSRTNINARYQMIDFARSNFEENPVYGVGVGLRKEYDATNIVWVCLAETGVCGLIGFILIHVSYFAMILRTLKRITPSSNDFTFLAVGCGLVANKLMHGMVDHYWSRGAIMMAWGAAGMATGVYYSVRNSHES